MAKKWKLKKQQKKLASVAANLREQTNGEIEGAPEQDAAAKRGKKRKERHAAQPPAKPDDAEASAGKPIKWKAIITRHLKAAGGRMSVDKLRQKSAEEAQQVRGAGRKLSGLLAEFDSVIGSFHKFAVHKDLVKMLDDPLANPRRK
eukprot:TRINITY_DN10666_c0_g1_i1.p1 TRINITY_DN10666_c0_g1~~TRINITY_DN10666_c0_g1_i1.p1  ORF type:complete len:146 (+),score=41.94 TRINITY_DN10666_c0_g1_i1:129-566(+)